MMLRNQRSILATCVVSWLALSPAPASSEEPPRDQRVAVAHGSWFRFHSDFEFNLYDALLASADARRRERQDPFASSCFASLVAEERSAWEAAVGYFAATIATTSDFSRERFVLRTRLAGFSVPLDDDDRRDLELALLFHRAAQGAYRACGWPEQDAINRRWIEQASVLVERYGERIGRRLEDLFGARFRRLPVDVDVVGTAGWAGADTIATGSAPTHVRISSRNPGYQGHSALEMIFHEAAHELVSPRNGPVAREIAAAAQEQSVTPDPNLWHGLLFETVGEVTRQILDTAGEGPYVPFTARNSVFQGSWAHLRAPLHEFWVPVVRGESQRAPAMHSLVRATARTPAASETNR